MMDYLADNGKLIGLLFFFAFFCGVIYYAFRPGSQPQMDYNAQIPLEDETNGTR